MSAKTLGKLLVALAILAALAWFQTRQRSHPAEEDGVAAGDSVLVGVDVNAVRSVFVERGGEKTELQRKSDHWVVTSLFDYPADFQKLAAVLRKFDDLEVGQVVPDGTTYLDDFGLSADSETNAPTLVKLASESGELLATLSLGAQKSGKAEPGGFGGFPVARYLQAGDGPVLLVDDTLSDVQTDGAAWIEKNLLGVQPNEVKSLTVTLSNETYTVRSLGGSQYELEGLSDDEELNQTVCTTLGRVLQNVRCNDIANPALPDEDLGFDQPATLSVVDADGVAYHVALGTTSDDEQARFARFSVTAEPLPEPTREQAEDSVRRRQAEAAADTNTEQQVEADIPSLVDAELDKLKAAYEAETEKLQQRVGELSGKFDGWTYLLSSYVADSMCFPRSELVTAKVEPGPASGLETADDTGSSGQEPSVLAKPALAAEEDGEIVSASVPEVETPPNDGGADEGTSSAEERPVPASKPELAKKKAALVADPSLESPERKDPGGKDPTSIFVKPKPAPAVEEVSVAVPEAEKPPSDGRAVVKTSAAVKALVPTTSNLELVADPSLESPEQERPSGQEPSTSVPVKPAPVVEEDGKIVSEAKKPPGDGATKKGMSGAVKSQVSASKPRPAKKKPAVVEDRVLESPEQKDPAGKESSGPDGAKPVVEAENVPASVAPTSDVQEQEDDATDVESRPVITSPPPVPGHPGTEL